MLSALAASCDAHVSNARNVLKCSSSARAAQGVNFSVGGFKQRQNRGLRWARRCTKTTENWFHNPEVFKTSRFTPSNTALAAGDAALRSWSRDRCSSVISGAIVKNSPVIDLAVEGSGGSGAGWGLCDICKN